MAKCYVGIETLPAFNWWKIHSEGNLAYLEINSQVRLHAGKTSRPRAMALRSRWKEIQEEFVAHFGFSQPHVEYMRKQMELNDLLDRRISSGDRTLNALIKVCILEMEEMEGEMKSQGADFWELKGMLDRAGFNIDPMRITVKEFHVHLKTLARQQNSASLKRKEQRNG